jgi:hypothetical protein
VQQNSSGADGGSMEFTAGSSSSAGVGGGWRGLFHHRVVKLGSWWISHSHFGIRRLIGGGSIAMNGGSGENSLGGSVTLESGVGTEATDSDLGAASFRPPMQVFLESVVACH